jgi:indole-3-glycerol phosphate synthase
MESSVLDRILQAKREEVAERSERTSVAELLDFGRPRRRANFTEALRGEDFRVIAEIKYRSPSHGPFRCALRPEEIARSFVENGACALSVLTDLHFFGGSLEHLGRISDSLGAGPSGAPTPVPLLRKDFIVDRYQVAEAFAWGAAAYLLIVAALNRGELNDLREYGASLELESLVEVHDALELETAVESGCRLIGVNNRNLKTFEVDINTSFELARRLEGERGYLLVAESGISRRSQLEELRDAGYSAFLVGGAFMDSDDPGRELRCLLKT